MLWSYETILCIIFWSCLFFCYTNYWSCFLTWSSSAAFVGKWIGSYFLNSWSINYYSGISRFKASFSSISIVSIISIFSYGCLMLSNSSSLCSFCCIYSICSLILTFSSLYMLSRFWTSSWSCGSTTSMSGWAASLISLSLMPLSWRFGLSCCEMLFYDWLRPVLDLTLSLRSSLITSDIWFFMELID